MTYKAFIESLRNLANELEEDVKGSQVIELNDEVSPDDTLLFVLEDRIAELYDNLMGEYGHVVKVGVRK